MTKIDLNIVSFDVPFPANYGGVIDVYYKIKALQNAGINVNLHCFDYGRGEQTALLDICAEVHYYKRSKSPFKLLGKAPYVVSSRASRRLLENLKKNEAPILFEGLHTSSFLTHQDLLNRKKMVRMHNIEHDYYSGLASVEHNFLKRLYFKREADKLMCYESVLKEADHIFAISHADYNYLNSKYGSTSLLPVFHSSEKMNSPTGRGDFAFYHGNLAVGENNEAALFLVNEVFSKLEYALVIAGSSPSGELIKACEQSPNVSLKSDLDTNEINELVRKAQVNVLPTFQATGIKLKLILSLFSGRFCMVNDPMVLETGLEDACIIVNSAKEWQDALNTCFGQNFTEEDIRARQAIISDQFCNSENIQILTNCL